MKSAFIYTLTDPRQPDSIRYVGVTRNPQRRLKCHVHDTVKKHTHTGHWVKKLITEGVSPVMTVIEECSLDIYCERERYWISYHVEAGYDLTNHLKGGQGLLECSEEHRAKLSEIRRRCIQTMWDNMTDEQKRNRMAKTLTPENVAASAERLRKWSLNPEAQKQANEKSQRTRSQWTLEQKQASIDKFKATISSPEIKTRQSAHMKEHWASVPVEQRTERGKKASDAARARFESMSPEEMADYKRKISETSKARMDALTPEQREARAAKISASRIAKFAAKRQQEKQI